MAEEDDGEMSAVEVTTEVVGLAVVVVGFIVDESNTAVEVESDSDIVISGVTKSSVDVTSDISIDEVGEMSVEFIPSSVISSGVMSPEEVPVGLVVVGSSL